MSNTVPAGGGGVSQHGQFAAKRAHDLANLPTKVTIRHLPHHVFHCLLRQQTVVVKSVVRRLERETRGGFAEKRYPSQTGEIVVNSRLRTYQVTDKTATITNRKRSMPSANTSKCPTTQSSRGPYRATLKSLKARSLEAILAVSSLSRTFCHCRDCASPSSYKATTRPNLLSTNRRTTTSNVAT